MWDDASADTSRSVSRRLAEPPPRKKSSAKPVGLPVRPRGLLRLFRDWMARLVASAEEIAFISFFLAFVAFALYWLRLILG